MSDAPASGGDGAFSADGPSDNLTDTGDLSPGIQTVYAGAGNFAAVAQMFKRRRIAEFDVDRKDHIASNIPNPLAAKSPYVPTDAQRGGVDIPRNLSASQFSSSINDPMKPFLPESFDMQDRSYKPVKPDESSSIDSRVRNLPLESHAPHDTSVKAIRNSGIKAYKKTNNG